MLRMNIKNLNSSLENMLCIFCKNSTIISTEKPMTYIYNKSTEENNKTSLFSICNTCNKYSYIKEETLLYHEVISKISNKLIDIKYDPKLITIDTHCTECDTDTQYKMFADNNNDLKFKYICVNCDSFMNI
jgi:hypothetical protein